MHAELPKNHPYEETDHDYFKLKYNFVKSEFDEQPSLAHLDTPSAHTLNCSYNKYTKECNGKFNNSTMGEKKTANDNEFNVKEMDTINVLNLYKDGSDFQEKSEKSTKSL